MTDKHKNQNNDSFRILVLDDDPLILKYYQVIFQLPRYHVQTAENGEEGLERARSFHPHLIISDVIMPKMDGYQFCKALRSEEQFQNTILIMSSSVLTEVKDAVKALEGGADDYLMKPIGEEQAKAKVEAFLRIKVLQDDLIDSNARLQQTVTDLEEHKQIILEKNEALKKEKEIIKNSLKEKSYLLGELEESNHALAAMNDRFAVNFDSLVKILAKIIEFRRPKNKGHANKVAEIAVKIAGKFEIDEEAVREINIAALLHEIGITALPDEIISKDPSELTIKDQQVIDQYPVIGERLLKNYDGLENVAHLVRHLLENVDGSGFPDGIIGNEIPLGARILRVAKDFDDTLFENGGSEVSNAIIQSMKTQVDEKYDDQVIRQMIATLDESSITTDTNYDHVYMSDLRSGMKLAEDLYTESGVMLIPEGSELSDGLIESIMKYNAIETLDQRIKINRQ